MIDGAIAGFASLKGADEIDMLFVDPEFARQGVGRTLVDALTRLAQARGAKRLTTEASDVAKPLFERLGFAAQMRNLVRKGDQWLANTTMSKRSARLSRRPRPGIENPMAQHHHLVQERRRRRRVSKGDPERAYGARLEHASRRRACARPSA